MYIQVSSNPEAPVKISRKLHNALGYTTKKNPCGAISISQIKGSSSFCIVPRTAPETFETQCSLVTPDPRRDRRTPSLFHWTIPSLEYIKHITGLNITSTKIIKVKPKKLPNMTVYILQT